MPFLGKTPTKLLDANVNIDGGNIDGTTIGASSTAPATVSTFTSTGIDDNATSTAITIDSSQNVSIGTTSAFGLVTTGSPDGTKFLAVDCNNANGSEIQSYNSNLTINRQGNNTILNPTSGNVGIGTSNPSFILGTGLHIDSTGYTSIVLQKGGAGQGHNIDFTDESNTLQYRIGTNFASGGQNLLFAYGSTPTVGMTLDSSGNVGIGISSLVNPLQVGVTSNTASKTSGSAFDGGAVRLDGGLGSTNSEVAILGGSNDGLSAGIGFARENSIDWGTQLRFYTHGTAITTADELTERMRIDSSGRLLVGKTSSSITTAGSEVTSASILQSASSTSTNLATNSGAVINLCNTSATDGNFSNIGGYNSNGLVVSQMNFINVSHTSRTGAITFSTHNGSNLNEAMRIDSSGQVGIGTTPNSYANYRVLTLQGTNGSEIDFENSSGTVIGAIYNNATDLVIASDFTNAVSSSNVVFTCDGTERMRIDSSGNLLIGVTTSVGGGSEGIELRGDAGYYKTARYTAGSAGHWLLYNSNGNVGSVTTYSNSTQFNTSSDQRLKENIVDAPAGNIDAIRVRSFDWKTDGSHQKYGMVAQELVDVAPEAVTQGETDDDMWQVDYSKLVPMMIKEIQDLKAEVAALKGA